MRPASRSSVSIRGRGRRGESRAAEFFRERGFTVLARNYRKLSGEIDLVLERGGVIYFVEVKTRNDTFRAEERIDGPKLERMRSTAEAYVAEAGLSDVEVRFLLAVVGGRDVKVVPLDEGLL